MDGSRYLLGENSQSYVDKNLDVFTLVVLKEESGT